MGRLAARVRGQNEDGVALPQPRLRIADEPIAIQVGDDRRFQSFRRDQLGEGGESNNERGEQLAKRVSVELQLGDTSPFARNAQKFDTHMDQCTSSADGGHDSQLAR